MSTAVSLLAGGLFWAVGPAASGGTERAPDLSTWAAGAVALRFAADAEGPLVRASRSGAVRGRPGPAAGARGPARGA
ncbi:hypothetical protein AAHZ94_35185, partial [Streptomyces sp. HSW2009]|uniref:hypothetical protein n=1 Tax=Streptomyces sp. HSW2009 TaxID=3142890 RepID=UPI0032EC0934